MREELKGFRMSRDEAEMLERISEAHRRTKSDMIRLLIEREYNRLRTIKFKIEPLA